jgi:YesN/AraC family two-component response regulator
VLQADKADHALELIESGAAIDLLLTDVVMPGHLNSVDLVRLARQLLPSLSVLYTSGYALNVLGPAERFGLDVELLLKPYTRETLARKLRQVFSKRSAPDPSAHTDVHADVHTDAHTDAHTSAHTDPRNRALG